ncbi:GxxExxY protein [Candidatus Cloacimonadota bacterium]
MGLKMDTNIVIENQIAYKIRGCIYDVYNKLGPGLFEKVYEYALVIELKNKGLEVKTQVPFDVIYEGINLGMAFRLDILVEDKVIIEVKSVETLANVHHKQLITYLKITGCKLGILVNFNTTELNSNIIRKANGLATDSTFEAKN